MCRCGGWMWRIDVEVEVVSLLPGSGIKDPRDQS